MKFSVLILFFAAVAFGIPVTGQSVSATLISSAGTTQTNEGHKVTWTLGDPVIGTMSGGSHQLGNGFLPSMDLSVFLADPEKENTGSIEVFPNPATSFLKVRNKANLPMKFKLTTMNGTLLAEGDIQSGDLIQVPGGTAGTLLLMIIIPSENESTSYKIVIK